MRQAREDEGGLSARSARRPASKSSADPKSADRPEIPGHTYPTYIHSSCIMASIRHVGIELYKRADQDGCNVWGG
jgi:hypothetical protein